MWLTAVIATTEALKAQTFFFWIKNKNSLMKPLTLSKTFLYLLNFPSTNSNLVTYLALYKEDQTTHNSPHRYTLSIPLSSSIFWNFIHFSIISLNISISFFIFLTKSIFLGNTYYTHYYPSLTHFNILKLHHFAAQKNIFISFFISHTKSSFLESNETHDIT